MNGYKELRNQLLAPRVNRDIGIKKKMEEKSESGNPFWVDQIIKIEEGETPSEQDEEWSQL